MFLCNEFDCTLFCAFLYFQIANASYGEKRENCISIDDDDGVSSIDYEVDIGVYDDEIL